LDSTSGSPFGPWKNTCQATTTLQQVAQLITVLQSTGLNIKYNTMKADKENDIIQGRSVYSNMTVRIKASFNCLKCNQLYVPRLRTTKAQLLQQTAIKTIKRKICDGNAGFLCTNSLERQQQTYNRQLLGQ
jgi:hypothetical protein